MPNKNTTILILIYILITCTLSASAETWHDDFDADNPDAWSSIGNDAIWKVEDGFLRLEVKREWEVEYALYQFTALPAPYRNFAITINDFGGDKTRFGFCLGRHFPDTPEENRFFTYSPTKQNRRFTAKGAAIRSRSAPEAAPLKTDVLSRNETTLIRDFIYSQTANPTAFTELTL